MKISLVLDVIISKGLIKGSQVELLHGQLKWPLVGNKAEENYRFICISFLMLKSKGKQ